MNNITSGMKVAVLILVLIFSYMTAATFLPIPKSGIKLADTIVPYLLGVFGAITGYYWGASSKGQPLTPVQTAAVVAAETKAEEVVEKDKPKEGGKENV
jgi:hypothetical protein